MSKSDALNRVYKVEKKYEELKKPDRIYRLYESSKTDEGRYLMGEMMNEVSELWDNASRCYIFEALTNIRNIGLLTGLYIRMEDIPINHPMYGEIVDITRNILYDTVEILKRRCGCTEL